MRARWAVVALVGVALLGGLAVLWAGRPAPAAARTDTARTDTVLLNDLSAQAAAAWPDVGPATFAGVDRRLGDRTAYAVVDADGRVRHRHGAAPTSPLTAAAAGAVSLPVVVQGRQVGMVLVVDEAREEGEAGRRRLVTTVALAALAALLLAGLAVVLRVHVRVLRPFRRMERFATAVAAGDLDTPLEQERGESFGAFTGAFDVMRTELARAREREAELTESRRALVAQLSHDIRTPVAAIMALAELLEVGARLDGGDAGGDGGGDGGGGEPQRRARLQTIREKAAQIDDLVGELFQANDDELAALPVAVGEHASAAVAGLVRAADVHGRVDLDPAPACLLSVDPRRLAQVLDNVLSNSAKYAGTRVRGTWAMEPDALRLRLADTGPGVPEAELGAVLGRGVRGSTVGDRPGQGLGLFTAAWLMERMGGGLAVSNGRPGFVVDLDLPLA